MRPAPIRFRRDSPGNLSADLSERVVGQPQMIERIIPYVEMYQANLAPDGRPAGVFLLLGPTGTGKTRTVEALAEVLHGTPRHLLRVDCGEFQMEHEDAKLIGAPPGYLGHRETTPMLTQQKLSSATSESSSLALVLFDEIEKAAPSMTRLLLGVLDKATLRLGDNTAVNFERTMIFLTSNLGAREMHREMCPDFGFAARAGTAAAGKLEAIGMHAVRKKFAPEFMNRVDAVITYRPLARASLEAIADQQIEELQEHIRNRLGDDAFELEVATSAREFLLRTGTSAEYGARELKRAILRHLTQPIASMVARGEVDAGAVVRADADGAALKLFVG